jgi:hypothetical protein
MNNDMPQLKEQWQWLLLFCFGCFLEAKEVHTTQEEKVNSPRRTNLQISRG